MWLFTVNNYLRLNSAGEANPEDLSCLTVLDCGGVTVLTPLESCGTLIEVFDDGDPNSAMDR